MDPKKDKELIKLLNSMIGYSENYNTINQLANLSMLTPYCSADVRTDLFQARQALAINSFETIKQLIKLLEEKYIR
ncbi:hypothetical protein AB6A23_09210 [Paenibacillus tarimensis]